MLRIYFSYDRWMWLGHFTFPDCRRHFLYGRRGFGVAHRGFERACTRYIRQQFVVFFHSFNRVDHYGFDFLAGRDRSNRGLDAFSLRPNNKQNSELD